MDSHSIWRMKIVISELEANAIKTDEMVNSFIDYFAPLGLSFELVGDKIKVYLDTTTYLISFNVLTSYNPVDGDTETACVVIKNMETNDKQVLMMHEDSDMWSLIKNNVCYKIDDIWSYIRETKFFI